MLRRRMETKISSNSSPTPDRSPLPSNGGTYAVIAGWRYIPKRAKDIEAAFAAIAEFCSPERLWASYFMYSPCDKCGATPHLLYCTVITLRRKPNPENCLS